MKDHFEIPNQGSAGFTKYRDFSISLGDLKGSGNEEENLFVFLETIKNLDAVYKFRAFDDLVDSIINLGLLDKFFPHLKNHFLSFLEVANKQSEESYALYYLYRVAAKTGLMKEHFPFFLDSIEKVLCPNMYWDVGLLDIAKAAYETGVIEDYFPIFLKVFDNLESSRKHIAIAHLIRTANQTGLIFKYFSALLERIEKLPEESKRSASYQLISEIDDKYLKDNRFSIENQFVSFLDETEEINHIIEYRAFGFLLEKSKIVGLFEDHISDFIEIVDKIETDHRYNALYDLIDSIQNTEQLDKFYLPIKKRFFFFLDDIEKFESVSKYDAFRALLKLEEGTGFISNNTSIFLELIKKISWSSVYAYSELLEVLKKTGMKQDHFPVLLEILDTFIIPSNYKAFCSLLEAANANNLIKDNFISLLEKIKGFNYINKYDAFHEFIKAIKSTDLMIKYKMDIVGTFQSLLKDFFKTLPDYEQYHGFIKLLEIAEDTKLKEKFLQEILAIIPRLPEIDSLDGCMREETYDNFVDEMENADLENLEVFKIWEDKNQHFRKDECY